MTAQPGKSTAFYQLLLHGIVLLWGLTAILGKAITLEKPLLVAWRTALAAAGLLLIQLWRKQPWPKAADALRMVAVGLLIGIHWLLFFLPGKISTISAGLVGIATCSLWCALLELFFPGAEGPKPWRLQMALALGVLLGAAVIGWNDTTTWLGLGVGAAAALVASIFSFFNAKLVRQHDVFHMTFFEMLGASLVMSVTALWLVPASSSWWPMGTQDWVLLLVLSQVCTVVAFSGCTWLQKRLSLYQVGLASNLEPVYGILLAAAVYHEHKQLKPSFWLGSGIILGCVLIYTLWSHSGQEKQQSE